MNITRTDRVAVLLLAASAVTLILGSVAIILLGQTNLPRVMLFTLIVLVLFLMAFFQERAVLRLLMARGYLCNACRSKSIVEDVRRITRGYYCRCDETAESGGHDRPS